MKKQKVILFGVILLILVPVTYQAPTCETSAATSGTNDGYWDRRDGVAGRMCSITTCATGYSDIAGGTQTNGDLTASCTFCATDYFLDAPDQFKESACVINTGTCQYGYTDHNRNRPNNPLRGNCQYCISTVRNLDSNFVCSCSQEGFVLDSHPFKDINQCTNANLSLCQTPFTDNPLGGRPTKPKLIGDCRYCQITSQKLVPDRGFGYYCRCEAGKFLNSHLNATGSFCITKVGGNCISGFTDRYGQTPNSPDLLGDCRFCQLSSLLYMESNTGICKCRDGNKVLDRSYHSLNVTCVIKNGGSCATGYTDNEPGVAATSGGGSLNGIGCVNCIILETKINTATGECQCSDSSKAFDRHPKLSGATCIAKNAGGSNCQAGYTDKSSGGTPNTDLVGDCKFCILSIRSPNSETGVCECMDNLQVLDRPQNASDATCINKINGACQTGYTDKSSGGTPNIDLVGDCKFCILSTTAPNSVTGECECKDNQEALDRPLNAPDATCITKIKGTCQTGYSDLVSGTPTSGSIVGDCKYCGKVNYKSDIVYSTGLCKECKDNFELKSGACTAKAATTTTTFSFLLTYAFSCVALLFALF